MNHGAAAVHYLRHICFAAVSYARGFPKPVQECAAQDPALSRGRSPIISRVSLQRLGAGRKHKLLLYPNLLLYPLNQGRIGSPILCVSGVAGGKRRQGNREGRQPSGSHEASLRRATAGAGAGAATGTGTETASTSSASGPSVPRQMCRQSSTPGMPIAEVETKNSA